MNKEEFSKAVALAHDSREVINRHIWDVFDKYVEDYKIEFTDPEGWEIDLVANEIDFHGSTHDGYGGYNGTGSDEPMEMSIPIPFFEDYEKKAEKTRKSRLIEERELAREQKEKDEKQKEKKKRETEAAEKILYQKLKDKYEGIEIRIRSNCK